MSNIVFNTIDENYPLAGQDNDSQGFRDNFSVIKDALALTKSEITVLENTTAKVSTQSGETVTNNFLGSTISNVQLRNAYKITQDGNIITNQIVVTSADYFRITKVDDADVTFTWPANSNNNYIKIRVEIVAGGTGPTRTIKFFGTPKTNFNNSKILSIGETGIFDCWIAGNDPTVYIQFIDKFAV